MSCFSWKHECPTPQWHHNNGREIPITVPSTRAIPLINSNPLFISSLPNPNSAPAIFWVVDTFISLFRDQRNRIPKRETKKSFQKTTWHTFLSDTPAAIPRSISASISLVDAPPVSMSTLANGTSSNIWMPSRSFCRREWMNRSSSRSETNCKE